MNKITKNDPQAQTQDIVNENISKLKELFPEVFSEGKIDFETLESLLGEYTEKGDERYNFTWKGKTEARRIAQTPSTATLRPAKEESKNWDTTKNLYIEGDNLEVLKLLQKSYHKKVKMIYIDPPYNTGKDFVYKDNYKDNLKNYMEITSQVDEEGNKISTNSDSSGRYHSNWLNMMYPRLKLARNLLKDEGVIFIHIDENEYTNLEKILEEIFGEENNLGTIVWDKRNPKGEVSGVSQQHEYISIYSRNASYFSEISSLIKKKENANRMIDKVESLIRKYGQVTDNVRSDYKNWLKSNKSAFTGGELAYNDIDQNGYIFRPVSMAAPDKPETRSHRPLIHPKTNKPCPVPEKGWRFSDQSMDELLNKDEILFGKDETTQPQRKYLLHENIYEKMPSLLYFGGSDDALGLPFDNPKPLTVYLKIIESIAKDGDIVLDFFSGSATTAHAVMQLNAEDQGNRKFIMVQLPEPTDEKSEAYKAGYKNICEIGKERIRRAGDKIVKELKENQSSDQQKLLGETKSINPDDLDIGFKVFKLDSSNIKTWDATAENIEQKLLDSVHNIKSERSEDDVLFEVLLKYGLDLTLPIEVVEINGKKIYSVGYGSLIVCLDDEIDMEIAKAIVSIKEDKKPETMNVIFKDTGFKDDVAKTNVVQYLEKYEVDSIRSI